MIKFLGRGSAFADEHNCAFVIENSDFILLDCPMSAFQKIKNMKTELDKSKEIYILVTHTHGDHISGIGTLIHFAYYVLHMPVHIIVPSKTMCDQIIFLLSEIENCNKNAYDVICTSIKTKCSKDKSTAYDITKEKKWFGCAIKTEHVNLKSGCFGYKLKIDNRPIIYTGDTCTLTPFESYLENGCTLYTEIAYIKSDAHLWIMTNIDYLKTLKNQNINVVLMHLDREQQISDMIKDTDIKLAPLYKPDNKFQTVY